jgi:N-methylhydantoinase A
MAWRIGVDSGGTFTDICLFEESSGRVEVWKVPSTPADPSSGIADGVAEGLAEVGACASEVSYLGHGTTVATNALIQGRGVKTGLITTGGFRDLLEIGRQKRPHLYDQQVDKPPVLVPRDLRLEVPERVLHTEEVEVPLDEEVVRSAVRQLKAAGVEAVAVCFLYSFMRPDHEELVARILAEEFPEAFSSISSSVAPEFREFERMSTAVINGYLGPVMRKYVKRLSTRLEDLGISRPPLLTQSNGGVISLDTAADYPVRTVLSGPSAGVIAAQALADMTGIRNLITFDMGGTSSDVALLTDGKVSVANEAIVHGYPIKAPMLDIHTVGAGGGSIAYIDNGGLLKVGPRSAGADPGPAAYGRGNLEPTVTDANLVLGTLNPEYLLNGRMRIDHSLSRAAIHRVADELGLEAKQAAEGILEIVTANMAKAIRVISVQRGFDPRDYTLVAFGGAGPLHAARLAEELGITRVMVPLTPGILCALGLLMTDLRADFAVTSLKILEETSPADIETIYDRLESRGNAWFVAEDIALQNRALQRTVDVRYLGQNYEISVPVPEGPITQATFDSIRQRFLDSHRQRYGFVADEDPIQMVTYRVEAIGAVGKVQLVPHPIGLADASGAIIGSRQIWNAASESLQEAHIYDRSKLTAGNVFEGPAIVEQMDATTFVRPNTTARVDNYLNLILEAK